MKMTKNLRVLGQEDIQHIFPGEEDDCIDVGDIVSAIWLPNGHFYDAKVLQKGSKCSNICFHFRNFVCLQLNLWLLVSFVSYFVFVHLTLGP